MPQRTRRTLRLFPIVFGAMMLVAGCGKVPGFPTAAEIDVRSLDVGNYPTTPLEFRYSYENSVTAGREIAAMRLADNMVLGTEVDSELRFLYGSEALLNQSDIEGVLANVNGPVIMQNNPVVGYGVTLADNANGAGSPNPEGTAVTVVVVQFSDAATAERVAMEAEAADFAVAADINQRVSIPNTPTAHAHWRPGIPTLGAMQSRGAYFMSVFVQTPDPDLSLLTHLARQALENQGRLLENLPPLSFEDALRLDNDPHGILRRMLHPDASGHPSIFGQAFHNRRGMLSRLGPQDERAAITEAAGVDLFARSGVTGATLMFRAKDAAAAESLGQAVLNWGSHTEPLESPEGVPGVRCGTRTAVQTTALRYRCTVPYQRYLASVESDQIVDLHQRAAAQYAMLANSY